VIAPLLLVASAALAVAAPLQGFTVNVDEQKAYYSLKGRTPQELAKASAVSGVRDQADGTKGAGGTVSELTARFSKDMTEGGGCALIAAQVTVSIRQKLPRWDDNAAGGDEARDWWRRFSAAISEHEDGHKKIDEESGDRLLGGLRALPAARDCDELDARVDAEIANAQAEQDARNAEYDRRTKHGKTQYAKYFGAPKT
jgi:predicted secreted Zn-dependent protease